MSTRAGRAALGGWVTLPCGPNASRLFSLPHSLTNTRCQSERGLRPLLREKLQEEDAETENLRYCRRWCFRFAVSAAYLFSLLTAQHQLSHC